MTPYCTIDFALDLMGLAQQTNTPRTFNKALALRNIRVASRRVDQAFLAKRPVFAPYIETRKISLDGTHVNSRMGTFNFPGWLLALNGTVSINGTNVTLLEAYPDAAMPPFKQLRLTDDCRDWYTYVCSCCTPLQVSIPGIWGFHPLGLGGWEAVDTLAANINSSIGELTVSDADGEDLYGFAPRFSPGALLKLDDEMLLQTKRDDNLNKLTVRRGVNGSTAAAHTAGAAVYVWQADLPVQQAVARQSGLMMSRGGAYTTIEVRDMNPVSYPADWLQEVYGVLQAYAYD